MEQQQWEQATSALLRSWLNVFAPPTELAGMFPEFAATFGAEPQDASDTPHFKHFTEALRRLAASYGDARRQPVDMGQILGAWLAGAKVQAQQLERALDAEVFPLISWFEAQTHPILGPARETHARWAAVARATVAHARALSALQRLHLQILAASLDHFGASLDDERAPRLSNVRDVFHTWAAAADEVYREQAASAEYGKAFAACVNTGSLLRQAWSRWQHGGSWLSSALRGQIPTAPVMEAAGATPQAPPPSAPIVDVPQPPRKRSRPARRPTTTIKSPPETAAAVRATPSSKRKTARPVPAEPRAKSRRGSPGAAPRGPFEFDITHITRPTEH